MKLIKESYKLVSGEAARSAALMLQFFLFTIIICLIFGRIECLLKLENRIKDAGLYDAVYFKPNSGFLLGQSEYKDLLPQNLLPINLKTMTASYNNGKSVCMLNIYDNSYWKLLEYDLGKGRRLKDNAVNEAVISADLATFYSVGDTVELMYGKQKQRINLSIVGILAENEQMLTTSVGGTGNNLAHIFYVPDNVFFTSKLSDENGEEPSDVTTRFGGGFICDTQGYSSEQLNNMYKSVGEFMSVKDIMKNSHEEKAAIVRYYGVFALIILIISLLGISINNLYTLRLNEKSFAVYYLSGLTLTGFTRILVIRAFILCALPVSGALCVVIAVVRTGLIGDVVFQLKYCVYALIFAVTVSFITSLPLYRKLKYTEPISFLKMGV
ncbi:MAG TPA: hypothetical protein VFD25_01555 [Clostridia bacterium]|nr:hypothetical protein [Clostridia bacterium]